MLSPDSRTVALDLLRPPPTYRLDLAVLTTYSLDLETMLALPLGVLAQSDAGVEELLADPLLLIQGLQEARDRIKLFVDNAGIALPRENRELYAMLESSVNPVRAPNGGAFHPKVWVARFVNEAGDICIRVAVLSRNLTYDRSWDVSLVSEGTPRRGPVRNSKPLAELIRTLPQLTVQPLSDADLEALETLADDAGCTEFPSPEGFTSSIKFHVLGLSPTQRSSWIPRLAGRRLLAMSPFLAQSSLKNLRSSAEDEVILISRQEALDRLAGTELNHWTCYTLSDAALAEAADELQPRPSSLHGKLIAVENGYEVTWFIGSANLTRNGMSGRNVEVMAAITGKRGRRDGKSGVGIDRFLTSGFMDLCQSYYPSERTALDPDLETLRERLKVAQEQVLAGKWKAHCEQSGDAWQLTLHTELEPIDGVAIKVKPVTLIEGLAQDLEPVCTWKLPIGRLTCFFGIHLSANNEKVDDVSFTLKVPCEGLPDGRVAHVLRALIDTPERFLRFLRALLGGLEGMVDWAGGPKTKAASAPWNFGLGGEGVIEDLVRVASRDPGRLEPIRRLVADLRSTEEGRKIIPDEFYAVWSAVDEAIQTRVEK